MLLRLGHDGSAPASGDLYGKVVGSDGSDGERLTRIRFTSVAPEDRERLARLVAAGVARA